MVNLSIRIDATSGSRIGPGKIALLEAIRSTGSITGASRFTGMSYRKTWLLVDEINRALRAPAVVTEIGGGGGGGATITPTGEKLISLYHQIEAHARQAADLPLRAIDGLTRAAGKGTKSSDGSS